jgi:Protein of unknown function (DUF2845)
MYLNTRASLSAVLLSAAPLVVQAGSLECQGNLITPGNSVKQLLAACGEPTSRNGDEWVYQMQGALPMVVTVGNGVVLDIEDATALDENPSSPGDSP